jgi:VWFA-related protein
MIFKGGGKMAREWCCVALLCAAINASAQSAPGGGTAGPRLIPRTSAEREAQYTARHRILLNVQVTDQSGHAVTGLDAQDFTLRINHQPETITSFQEIQDGGATAHARAFLVIDMLNNSAHDLANAHKAIEKLADSAKRLPLPTSLVVLTEKGTEVSGPTRNAVEAATELERVTRNFHPTDCTEDWNNAALGKAIGTFTSLDDINRAKDREKTADRIGNCLNRKYQLSFAALLDFAHHQKDVPGRAILIWIGPGWPILSGPEFAVETPDVRESFFANLVQVSTELREGQVTLDAVSWPASSPIAKLTLSDLETLRRGTSTAAQASARSVAMPVLAHLSGGQVYMHEKNLTPELAACLADANSYYVLGFVSVPSVVSDELRIIEVTVDRPGLTVRTNSEYYGQP